GFVTIGGLTFQVTSLAVHQGEETIGVLSVGEIFDFSEFSTPAVLSRHGVVEKSSIPGIPLADSGTALQGCDAHKECEVRLGGETYLSMPIQSISFGGGYLLRTLQNVDSASRPVLAVLRLAFLVTGAGAILAALVLSALCSRSIVRPIANVISHLR